MTTPGLAATIRTVLAAHPDAERLATALDAATRLWLIDVAGELAAQVSGQLPAGHVEVRLAGRDPELVYVPETDDAPPPADERDTARVTLRLPDQLKRRVEQAAAREGVSTNAWLVRAIARATEARSHTQTTGKRLTGYAQS